MDEPTTLTISVSRDELFAAAGLLSLITLPLPGESRAPAAQDGMAQSAGKGAARLIERGLLRQYSRLKMELDPTLAAMVLVLGNPESSLAMMRFNRDGARRFSAAYFVSSGAVSVLATAELYQVTLHADATQSANQAAEWLGLEDQADLSAPSFTLPMIYLDTLLPLMWSGSDQAHQQLKNSGLSASEIQQAADGVRQADFAGVATNYHWVEGDARRTDELVILGTTKRLWLADSVNVQLMATFKPMAAVVVRQWLTSRLPVINEIYRTYAKLSV